MTQNFHLLPHFGQKLKVALGILLLILLNSTVVQQTRASNLPDIGNSADGMLSPIEEKKLGKEFMRSVRATFPVDDDPLNSEYIQYLGEHLVSQIDTLQQSFSFFIVKDSNINAFAGPGGYIGINTGLILATHVEDELASVVAHEIAHVVQRHLVRSFEKSQQMSLPALAAIIAAVLLGKGHGDVTGAVIASTVGGMSQQQLTFSRQHEQEADHVGITMLAGAGYDPHNMATFFETLDKSNRFGYGNIPEFLLTHPVTISRIADARGRADQINTPIEKTKDELYYELIRARLYVATLTDKTSSGAAAPQKPNNKYTNTERYQEILILFSQGKLALAKEKLKLLIKKDKNRLPYLVTQAELDLAAKDFTQAQAHLKNSLMLYPYNTPLVILYAKSLIFSGDASTAMNILMEQIRRTTNHNQELYRLHADASKEAGHISEAHESLAEYYFIAGQIHTAIKHIQLALQHSSGDKFKKVRLSARLAEFKSEIIDNQEDRSDRNQN